MVDVYLLLVLVAIAAVLGFLAGMIHERDKRNPPPGG